MVVKLLQELLNKLMDAYVFDMLVKSNEETTLAKDLVACFEIMEQFNRWLNSKKCAFAVCRGKFWGYMVTQREIEPNPKRVKVILDMQPPCWSR